MNAIILAAGMGMRLLPDTEQDLDFARKVLKNANLDNK